MAMTANASAAEQDAISWVTPPRRPKPQFGGADSKVFDVSRNSGLNAEVGTFGVADRFNCKLAGPGCSSPDGLDFYKRNQLFKCSSEKGLECSQGIGDRPQMISSKLPKRVGPGSYDLVVSAAKRRSPFDGPEYCSTSIGVKLPSKLIPADCCSPGPHHKYEVCKPLDHHRPKYHLPTMHHQTRHQYPEDRDTPGPGAYTTGHFKSCAQTASCPDLSSTAPVKPRTVKSTFGVADRFRTQGAPNSSPNGSYYYSRFKFKDKEDYLSGARSCTFGQGGKTDFSNPLNGPRFDVSPVTYRPVASTASKTSPLDGLTRRSASPVTVACKNLAAAAASKRSAHSRKTS